MDLFFVLVDDFFCIPSDLIMLVCGKTSSKGRFHDCFSRFVCMEGHNEK